MVEIAKPGNKAIADLIKQMREQHGLPANGFVCDSKVLEKVRTFESEQAAITHQIKLATARGEDLERMALLDPLTELYNHYAFIKELKAELNRAERYQHSIALSMISIDNFAQLTEKYGSLTADAVLKIVGNIIKGSVRSVDIAARYNEHQFVIALARTGISGGAIVAERIRQRIGSQSITYNWQSFSITASFGASAYPVHSTAYDELLAQAMQAMQVASNRGGDRVLAA